MGGALLRVESMDAFYGDSQILFKVGLQVDAGEVVALIGRNGAGKTTTLRGLMGFPAPRVKAHDMEVSSTNISGMPTYQRVKTGLGFVPEDRRIFAGLTVGENLQVAAANSRVSPDYEFVYEVFPRLRDLIDKRGDRLSGGEQQMLTIARTLMTQPQLILLDEPTEGLAPLVVQDLLEKLKLLKASGIGMLVAEQNLRFMRHLCDRAYVLEGGTIRYQGTMQELDRDEALWQPYISL